MWEEEEETPKSFLSIFAVALPFSFFFPLFPANREGKVAATLLLSLEGSQRLIRSNLERERKKKGEEAGRKGDMWFLGQEGTESRRRNTRNIFLFVSRKKRKEKRATVGLEERGDSWSDKLFLSS